MSAAVVTIALAFVGYLVTYLNGLRLAQRQERLARVNRQLADFYGPLHALTATNQRMFQEFMARHARPDGRSPFQADVPPDEREKADWRLWAGSVFLPNIRSMRDIVVRHPDLLDEPGMPEVLLDLYAHVAGYEVTAARWERGDFDEHLSVVPFPADALHRYAEESFARLQAEQRALLGRRRPRQGRTARRR
ncbi:hypothetical protein [Streptomyces sp. NPDC090025]|uniref:hypothetical protein n=1 Tax=Streptomyces sp. NPDC090025 TaxID=3365922 RepID=UPI003832C469